MVGARRCRAGPESEAPALGFDDLAVYALSFDMLLPSRSTASMLDVRLLLDSVLLDRACVCS